VHKGDNKDDDEDDNNDNNNNNNRSDTSTMNIEAASPPSTKLYGITCYKDPVPTVHLRLIISIINFLSVSYFTAVSTSN